MSKHTVELAKSGRAQCKDTKCKKTIEKGELRIGTVVPNPFGDGGEMTKYYHPECRFSSLTRARTLKAIESSDQIEGFADLSAKHKKIITDLIAGGSGAGKKSSGKTEKKKISAKGSSRKGKRTKKVADDDEGDEAEEKKPKAKPKTKAKAAKAKKESKKPAKKRKAENDDGGDGDEDEEEKPKKKKAKAAGSKKKSDDGGGAGVQYFESDSKSGGKFWEVRQDGAEVYTRYGKIGAAGATTVKNLGSVDKATKEVAKLIRQKTGKGYSAA